MKKLCLLASVLLTFTVMTLLAQEPSTAKGYTDRAWGYKAKGDFDLAIADCTKAIQINPNYKDAYLCRAHSYYDKGDYDRAAADYTQLIRLEPDNIAYYQQRAYSYKWKKDYDSAIETFTQAIQISPFSLSGYTYYTWLTLDRGRVYKLKNDIVRANADFDEVISKETLRIQKKDIPYVSPTTPYSNRADAYMEKNDYDNAIADYEAILKINPDDSYAATDLEKARQAKSKPVVQQPTQTASTQNNTPPPASQPQSVPQQSKPNNNQTGNWSLFSFIENLISFIKQVVASIFSNNNQVATSSSSNTSQRKSSNNNALANTTWQYYNAGGMAQTPQPVGNGRYALQPFYIPPEEHIIYFGNGTYRLDNETGTFSASSDTVILTSSTGRTRTGSIIGNSLEIGGKTYTRTQ